MTADKDQVPADDVLVTLATPDGAAVAAVHDRTGRSLDIACSAHGTPYTFLYSRGATVADIDRSAEDTVRAAVRHAAIRHTLPAHQAGGSRS